MGSGDGLPISEAFYVFNERDHVMCVEPYTAPPDALNITPQIVTPERSLIAKTRFSWRLL